MIYLPKSTTWLQNYQNPSLFHKISLFSFSFNLIGTQIKSQNCTLKILMYLIQHNSFFISSCSIAPNWAFQKSNLHFNQTKPRNPINVLFVLITFQQNKYNFFIVVICMNFKYSMKTLVFAKTVFFNT